MSLVEVLEMISFRRKERIERSSTDRAEEPDFEITDFSNSWNQVALEVAKKIGSEAEAEAEISTPGTPTTTTGDSLVRLQKLTNSLNELAIERAKSELL